MMNIIHEYVGMWLKILSEILSVYFSFRKWNVFSIF